MEAGAAVAPDCGGHVISGRSFARGGSRMIRYRTLCSLLVLMSSLAFGESQLRFCLRTEPKTFNPLLVANDGEETIRYLTGGVLVRVNRQTQDLQPELAVSWKVSKDGRQISFKLRSGVVFSDGTP